jgi:hypothetical protein
MRGLVQVGGNSSIHLADILNTKTQHPRWGPAQHISSRGNEQYTVVQPHLCGTCGWLASQRQQWGCQTPGFKTQDTRPTSPHFQPSRQNQHTNTLTLSHTASPVRYLRLASQMQRWGYQTPCSTTQVTTIPHLQPSLYSINPLTYSLTCAVLAAG